MCKMKPCPTFSPLNIPFHSDAKCTVIAVSCSRVLWTCSLRCMSAYTINTNITPINSWPCSEQHEFPPACWSEKYFKRTISRPTSIISVDAVWLDKIWPAASIHPQGASLIIMCCISFVCKTLNLSEKHFTNAMVHSALARMVICLSEF